MNDLLKRGERKQIDRLLYRLAGLTDADVKGLEKRLAGML